MLKKLLSRFNTKQQSPAELIPESLYEVTITDERVVVTRPDGETESVEWVDLLSVIIETTDEGPFVPDVFWILVGTRSECVVPQGAKGENNLLGRLQQLPGFDNEKVIAASVSTENAKFVCWKVEE
jgi:hypothetical protein